MPVNGRDVVGRRCGVATVSVSLERVPSALRGKEVREPDEPELRDRGPFAERHQVIVGVEGVQHLAAEAGHVLRVVQRPLEQDRDAG